MAYTPLATLANLTATPLNNLVRGYTQTEEQNLLIRASRAIEQSCGRRLAPFTNLTESQRAQMVDPDEVWDMSYPLDPQGTMAMSRAQALGASDLVRHFWVRQYPAVLPELWQGSITSINVLRAIGGSQIIAGASIASQTQYEADTGHVRFYYGAYVPPGSTLIVTYSGGYNPVPDDLIQATILRAGLMAIIELKPEHRDQYDLTELRAEIAGLIAPYMSDGDDW